MSRDFVGALLQLNAEKGVSREQLIWTVEEAIQSAYRRTPGDEDIHVRIDAESGKVRVFRARFVAEEIEDPTTQISVADAQAFQPGAEPGDLVETEQLDQEAFGRSTPRRPSRSCCSGSTRPSATSSSTTTPAARAS